MLRPHGAYLRRGWTPRPLRRWRCEPAFGLRRRSRWRVRDSLMADDGGRALHVSVEAKLSAVRRAEWDALACPPGAVFNPFVCWDFLEALEETGCVSAKTGWAPAHL